MSAISQVGLQLGLVLLVLFAGCGKDKQPEPPAEAATTTSSTATARPVLLACGGDTVRVLGARDTLQLNVDGDLFTVVLVPSASGARYQVAGDSTTFYWNQGTRGLVQVRGELLPECEMVPEL